MTPRCAFAVPLAMIPSMGCRSLPPSSDDAGTGLVTGLTGCDIYYENTAYDAIIHRCECPDGIPVWWRYADSARLYVGFGQRPHDSGFFGIVQDGEVQFEWRGVASPGGAAAHSVIVQLARPPGDPLMHLPAGFTVFRLREDGTSCIIAVDMETGSEARSVADQSAETYECFFEPNLYAGELANTSP